MIRPYLGLLFLLCLNACGLKNNAPATTAESLTTPELYYTRHARCRMECRHINETEIKEVIAENHINRRKSNPDGSPCPVYAYEGNTTENQHLRVVVAKCEREWKIVTCIDLDHEFECDCK